MYRVWNIGNLSLSGKGGEGSRNVCGNMKDESTQTDEINGVHVSEYNIKRTPTE